MDKLLGYLLVGIIGYVVVVALLNTLGIPEGWSWAIPAIIILDFQRFDLTDWEINF